jgi:hypothetical protein
LSSIPQSESAYRTPPGIVAWSPTVGMWALMWCSRQKTALYRRPGASRCRDGWR